MNYALMKRTLRFDSGFFCKHKSSGRQIHNSAYDIRSHLHGSARWQSEIKNAAVYNTGNRKIYLQDTTEPLVNNKAVGPGSPTCRANKLLLSKLLHIPHSR